MYFNLNASSKFLKLGTSIL